MDMQEEIRRGCSLAQDPVRAAREFHAAVAQPDGAGLVVFFCSPTFDLDALAGELKRLFGDTLVIGCTTAGEIGPDGYTEGSVSGFSLPAGECCAASELILSLESFQMARGQDAAEAVGRGLQVGQGVPEREPEGGRALRVGT